MEKFEYMQLVYSSLESMSRGLSNDLNNYGDNGWEAYAVRTIEYDRLQVFLKRKISE